jgi:hypothetical protein
LLPGPHASPDAVQKLAAWPTPPGAPTQHVCPSAPQVPHEAFRHMPRAAVPQLWPVKTQEPSTQQRLFPHVAFWQQG